MGKGVVLGLYGACTVLILILQLFQGGGVAIKHQGQAGLAGNGGQLFEPVGKARLAFGPDRAPEELLRGFAVPEGTILQ